MNNTAQYKYFVQYGDANNWEEVAPVAHRDDNSLEYINNDGRRAVVPEYRWTRRRTGEDSPDKSAALAVQT